MRREIGTFLLFVLLATVMWYGHAMQSVRDTRVPVHIQYTGKPHSVGLGEEGLPSEVQIEVRDAGARLNNYYSDPLRLTIDLRPYIHGEKGTIHIPSDVLRRGISDILQGTSKLLSTTPEEITCTYYTEEEKTVPVVFAGEIRTANEYQLTQAPKLSVKQMRIFGRDRVLATIDTLYTEPVVLEGLSDTTELRIALAVPANLRAEQDSVSLCVNVERFTEKKFTVPVRVINAPEEYTVRLFPSEVEVSVRVSILHFNSVQASDIQASCTYSPDRKDKLDVEIHYKNPYITDAWAYPGVVEFLLLEQ